MNSQVGYRPVKNWRHVFACAQLANYQMDLAIKKLKQSL